MALDRRLAVAPMMDWTDRHDRYFLRLLSRRTLLYSEMVTTGAVIHGDRQRLLGFDPSEHPVALQLGGSDPIALAESARIGADFGYDEINLNCGCPSDRVQSGRFGACLMAEPAVVAQAVKAMRQAVSLPVTVKHRIGIDDQEDWPDFLRFVDIVADGGCSVFIVHARKAWLSGLSPKENRDIPPLRYELVERLKAERPELTIVINGGITDLAQAEGFLARGLDGVMIGRAAYQEPWLLADADQRIFRDSAAAPLTREAVIEQLIPYCQAQAALGVPVKAITRHILGLYSGQPGARRWRRFLSENAHQAGADAELLRQSLALVGPRAPARSAA